MIIYIYTYINKYMNTYTHTYIHNSYIHTYIQYVRSASSEEHGSTGHGCQCFPWSAEQEKLYFSCPHSRLGIWPRETGSTVPSRVSPPILYTQAESDWLVLTPGISPAFRDGVIVHLVIQPVKRHRVNPEYIRPRNGMPMAFTAESPPARGVYYYCIVYYDFVHTIRNIIVTHSLVHDIVWGVALWRQLLFNIRGLWRR